VYKILSITIMVSGRFTYVPYTRTVLLFTVDISYNIVYKILSITIMVSGRFTYVGIPYTRTDTGQTDTGQTDTGQTSV
jgi:hypothetical protein